MKLSGQFTDVSKLVTVAFTPSENDLSAADKAKRKAFPQKGLIFISQIESVYHYRACWGNALYFKGNIPHLEKILI